MLLLVVLWQVTGKCGSVRVRLVPAPRGCGLVAAPVPKKLLNMAGVKDVYTSTTGNSRTLGNFVKVRRTRAHTHSAQGPDESVARLTATKDLTRPRCHGRVLRCG